jgi:hypothetical protein
MNVNEYFQEVQEDDQELAELVAPAMVPLTEGLEEMVLGQDRMPF